MQNALTVYLNTIEGLIQDDQIPKAVEAMLQLNDRTQASLRPDIILLNSNYVRARRQFDGNLIDPAEFRRAAAQTVNSLLNALQDLQGQIAQNVQTRNLDSWSFNIPDDDQLAQITGGQGSLQRINWLNKALLACKAVCRIVCDDGTSGTGFLTREGCVMTSASLLPSAEKAGKTVIELNLELDGTGAVQNKATYALDPSDFKLSPPDQFDVAVVRIKDRPDQPLRTWGYLELAAQPIPAEGNTLALIQFQDDPGKQLFVNAGTVLGQLNQYLFFTSDQATRGSILFNQDWNVVALLHDTVSMDAGGVVVNARGDRKGASRAVLSKYITGFLNNETPVVETTQPTVPDKPVVPPPVTAPVQVPKPVSAVPKFVMVYDVADDAQCKLLNKHLNILKITHKIRVYNVQEAPPGEDALTQAQKELADADYMVVLLTVNLVNSTDWFNLAYEALGQGRRIIPIRIGDADVDGTGFEKLRSLPTLNRTVADFANPDAAYLDIVGEMKKLLPR
jgi:hypothetical protein